VSDIDTVVVDSLKVLDPERPIREATLFELASKVPGSKVLPDRWGEERHAIGIPKGREDGAPYIKAFTEDVLKRGLVTTAMDRAGLRGALPRDAK
jgi:polar amino acid transport system substrate-binding protein